MKPFARNMMFTSVVAMAAGSMAIAQTNNNSFEQWYRATYGRPSPTEMARVSAVQANTAYREETPRQVAAPANTAISIGCGLGVAEQLPRSQDSNVENRRMFLDARAPDMPARYSASEIRKIIHDAKTPDDFRRLADYFDFRSMEFEQKAEVQLKELQRLLALPYHARIYATQVDNTRELLKRYKAQAQAARSMAVAQTSNSSFEQWYRAKYGRPSPTEEARMTANEANTAYRAETPSHVAEPANTWYEGWYRAKFGRSSPTEEAPIQAEQSNTAYREETAVQVTAPGNNWYEGWYRAKFGRPSPLEEMRLKDQTR